MNAKSDDILLFYFSGHGINIRGEVYLSSPGVDPSTGTKGLRLSELLHSMDQSHCKQIVCVIDACYSGALAQANDVGTTEKSANRIWQEISPNGVHLMLSSTAYEESLTEKNNNSRYTKYFLKGFEGVKRVNEYEWSGSLNEYGYLTPNSLHQYVYHNVARDTNEKQHPVYERGEGISDIIILYYSDKASRTPEIDSEVERIDKLSDLATYFNVNTDRIVSVRPEALEQLKKWIRNWYKSEIVNRKKILLITGVPGCGKSWFTFKLISELFKDGCQILVVKGDKIDRYPSNIAGNFYPIFILDDRHVGLEGIIGDVPPESICRILEKSTQFNFAGPIVISIRKDLWNRLVSGSVTECKEFPQSKQENIVEIEELDISNKESIEVTDKILSSFYESVDGKSPPFRLHIGSEIKKKIIEKSRCNLIILKIFLEQIGRTRPDNYSVTSEDIEKIISDPLYFILRELFDNYFSKTKNPFETAEILAGLHYIAKSGSMSLGSLYNLWRTYYQDQDKSRPLPEKVYIYLSHMFTGRKPYEWPPPLFDIDRYGSIISFHGSVDRTLIKLLEDPAKVIRQMETDLVTSSELGEGDKEYIERNLEHVRINISLIRDRMDSFQTQYNEYIENWITSSLEQWEEEKALKPNHISDKNNNGRETKLNILPQDAYYFLSMFKEFIEPEKKFDIFRYEKFKSKFQSVYSSVMIEAGIGRGEIATTINRLLYYLFERAAREDLDKSKGKLLYQYGAYETDLDLMLEDYFPDKNVLAEPVVSNNYEKLLLLRRVGLSLMTIGRLNEAEILYDKSYNVARHNNKWSIDVAKVLQLKSELYIHQGRAEDSMSASNEAIGIYAKEVRGMYCSTGEELWGVQNIAMGPIQLIICSLAYQAWILHLVGCHDQASVTFEEAERLAREINPQDHQANQKFQARLGPMHHLRDLWGIYYSDHLLKHGGQDSVILAKSINDENLAYAEWNGLTEIISQCHRVSGDINTWYGDECKRLDNTDYKKFYKTAGLEYIRAQEIAQKTSHHAVLTEASLGIGNWLISSGEHKKARIRLQKAYESDETKNYKFYKADLEIALAIAYAADEGDQVVRYKTAASKTCEEIHYYRENEAKSLKS
jgi:tetratricopeptide (TPR) repeat protein